VSLSASDPDRSLVCGSWNLRVLSERRDVVRLSVRTRSDVVDARAGVARVSMVGMNVFKDSNKEIAS